MTAPMGTSPASRANRASFSAKPMKKLSIASELRRRSAVESPFVSPFADLRFAIVYEARRYGTGSGSDLAPLRYYVAPGRYRSLYRTGAPKREGEWYWRE